MTVLFASDIHGYVNGVKNLVRAAARHHADFIVLTGDILGGRGLMSGVNRNLAEECLLSVKTPIVYTRGNCDGGRESLLFDFKSYYYDDVDGYKVFACHGHNYSVGVYPEEARPLPDVAFSGHTHRYALRRDGSTVLCNVGSIACPRGGNPCTYAVLENGSVTIYNVDGTAIDSLSLKR